MKTKLVGFAIAAAFAASAIAPIGVASAAPGDNGQGFGGCVDNFYGNATNARPSGHGVLPSQSPGPWVNNPSDPDNPTFGWSMGDVMQFLKGSGLHGQDAQDMICQAP